MRDLLRFIRKNAWCGLLGGLLGTYIHPLWLACFWVVVLILLTRWAHLDMNRE